MHQKTYIKLRVAIPISIYAKSCQLKLNDINYHVNYHVNFGLIYDFNQ